MKSIIKNNQTNLKQKMSVSLFCFIYVVSFIIISNAVVNRYISGDLEMCNFNPYSKYKIKPLNDNDLGLIHKLEQIHVLYRHGLRMPSIITEGSLMDFFPTKINIDNYQHISCNVTTITQRSFNTDIKLNKLYVDGSGLIPNTNCADGQTIYDLDPQMKQNGMIISDAYFTNNISESNKLYIDNITKNDINIISSDWDRTISSVISLLSNLDFTEYDVHLHDQGSEPMSPTRNIHCNSFQEYRDFLSQYSNDPNGNTKARNEFYDLPTTQNIIKQFEAEGGIQDTNILNRISNLEFFYCTGYDIPLSNDTWWDIINASTIYRSLITNTEYSNNMDYCYNKILAEPFLDIFKNNILTGNKINIYSGHGENPRFLLASLKMFEFKPVINGEMVTMEIYSKKDNHNEYWFRFTRLGQVLHYPHNNCSENSELCDLNILMENSLSDTMDLKSWENNVCPYMLTNQTCGYSSVSTQTSNTTSNTGHDWHMFFIGFLGGLLAISVLIGCYLIYRNCRSKPDELGELRPILESQEMA